MSEQQMVEQAGRFGIWAAGILFTICTAMTGALYKSNDRRMTKNEDNIKSLGIAIKDVTDAAAADRLAAQTAVKDYRAKSDCKEICEGFQEAFNGLKGSMDAGFKTLHEYLRTDVGDIHKRIDGIAAARKACKCQEGQG